jgi:aspartate aminotransferase
MLKLRTSISQISISPTNEIKRLVKEMKKKGRKIIRFDTIETNVYTPENVKKATIKAIRGNFTKYTQYSGLDELKSVVRELLRKKYSLTYDQEEVLISCGSKHAIFNAIFVTLDKSSETIIFAPYWTTFSEQVKIAGGTPVVLSTKEIDGFQPTIADVQSLIKDSTRLMIVNSPCNPTGVVYKKSTLMGLASLAIKHDLWVVSDETLGTFAYRPSTHIPMASLNQKIKDRTFTAGSVSKDYSMSGFRIGYVCGPRKAISAMSNLQAQCTANPVSFCQVAAIEAWSGPQTSLLETKKEFMARKELLEKELAKIKGLTNIKGQGAVFLFPNFSYYIGKRVAGRLITCAGDLTRLFLENGVATAQGDLFGKDYSNYIRFSYSSADLGEIKRGMKIIHDLLLAVK